mgnify:FL=1
MKKLVVLCVLLYSCSENDDLEQISYSQFKQEVLANQIVEITYKRDQMTIIGDRFDGSKFETTQPIYKKDEVLERVLKENNVRQT